MRKSVAALLWASCTCHTIATATDGDTLRMSVGEVVVTGTRHATGTRHLPITVSVVDRKKLAADHRRSVLPTLTEQVPGLFVTTRGMMGYGVSTGAAGNMKIRGVGGGAAMLVLVDGQPQYAGLYGHPIADACQTQTVGKVEVARGPASMIYGSNAMGGVMNMITHNMTGNGTISQARIGGGSYGSIDGEMTCRMKKGPWNASMGANYGRTDGHRPDSEFEQYGGFARTQHKIGRHWTAGVDLNITHFNNANPGTTDKPMTDNDMRVTRGMASAAITNEYDKTSGAVRAYYSWGHHNIDDGYKQGEKPRTALYLHNDRMIGVSLYQSTAIFKGNRTTIGTDIQFFGGTAWNRPKNGNKSTILADKTENETAAYIDVRQDLTQWLTIGAGIRFDRHSVAGTEWVPQGGITLRLSGNDELRAIIGKGFRNPTIKELYMFNPKNPDLKPESIVNHELAYSVRMYNGRLRVGVNVFYLRAKNLISTVHIDGKPINVNTGKTENSGAEMEVEYRASSKLEIEANYSFLHTSAHITGAPRHKAYAGIGYYCRTFDLKAGMLYFAGLMTDEGSNASSHAALLHMTASWRAMDRLRFYVRGDNLLSQKYETYKGFVMPRTTLSGGMVLTF